MAKVVGAVDDRGRPTIRLRGTSDDFLVIVDTGFNGNLLLTRSAAQMLGVDPQRDETEVELGDGTRAQLYEADARLNWLGESRRVRVLVSNTWIPTRADDPVGLLGTALLDPHLLLVDFASRSVEIETQA